ncbi:MAG: 50S ribosomal protein L21 [Bacteroidota bacterium]
MYAIVDIAGQQFKVEKDQKLYVHRLEGEEGKKVSFDKVLLIDSGSKVSVGDPVVKGAAVGAKIVSHLKGDKVLVFKKKRRKGYKKLNGHRQHLTQIQIETISEKAAKKPAAKKEEASKTVAAKAQASKQPAAAKETTTTKKAAPAAKQPAAAKETTAKKAATKKPAAKKPAAKKAAPKKDAGEDKATK